MKRFARMAAIIGGSLVVLLIVGAASLRFLLPPEKARLLIEKQLTSRLGREVQLGSLSISGLSTFRIKGIQISEAPTFKAGTFLTADSFAVTARLLPLIFGHVMVKEIVLDRPKLTIVRNADGSFNGIGIGEPVPTDQGQKGTSAKPGDLSISDVRLNAGSVTFVDKSTAALSAVLDPIDVHLSHVSLVAPVALDGTATALFRRLETKMKFEAGFDPLKGDATLEHLDLSVASASAGITGHVKNFFGSSPEFNGNLTWKGLDPSSFTALAALPDGLSVKGPTNGRLDVSGTAPSVESRLETDLSAADVKWKDLLHKPSGVALTAKMALDRNKAGDLKLHDLLIKLASVELSGEGTLKGSSETAHVASFRVETNKFEVGDLFRYVHADIPGGIYLSGPVKATVSMDGWTGGGRFVADFDGTGLAARYGEKFQKAPGATFRLVADGRYAEPLAVDFSSVRLDFDQLSMSGKGSYTAGKDFPTYVFRVKTNAFPLKSMAGLLPITSPYEPNGQAVVNMRVSRGAAGPVIAGDATLLAAGATIQKSVLSDLTGTLEFTNDSVTTAKLTGKIQGDALQMSLHASQLLSARPMIEADIRAAKLDLARLIPPDAPKKTGLPRPFEWLPFSAAVAEAADPASPPFIFDTKGSLRATTLTHPDYSGQDLVFEWDLKAVTSDMDKITGKAKLRHGHGRAKNLRALMDGSKTAKLILGPLGLLQKIDSASGGALKIPSLENFDFNSISGDYNIKDGVATLVPMLIEAPFLSSRADGTVGLAGAQPVNLRIVLNIRADQLQGVLGQALAAAGGATQTIKMTMTGTVNDPKVSVDQKALEEKAKEVIKNIDFKSLGDKLLKGLSK